MLGGDRDWSDGVAGGICITGGPSMIVNGTSTTGGVGCGTGGAEDGGVTVFRDCAEIRLWLKSEFPERREPGERWIR